nr:hypothetical protein [Tanacetum cinerariifolium]
MFTRSIVIQRRVEDLQLGVKSYQKKLNLTNPDMYHSDLKHDRLKGIQMKYLPQAIWRRSDKERAAAMIQAIDKQLKTRRIMILKDEGGAKGKQPAKSSKAKGLSVLFEVAMIEAEQIKLATKRSLQQTHISQASGSGADEGTGILPGVLDV